jgi:hypothetical protein
LFGKTFGYFAQIGGGQVVQSFRILIFGQLFLYVRSDVQNFVYKGDSQPLAGKFFFAAHSPEAVSQIVVFY